MAFFISSIVQITVLYFGLLITASLGKENWDTCHFGSVKCLCQKGKGQTNLLKADCSNRGLRSVPVFSSNVTWIDLSNNRIYWINNWFPSNVTYLDLSRNSLYRLYGHPFRGLYNLKTLNLERNQLNQTYFYEGFFDDLHSLTELNLKSNIPTYIPHGYLNDKEYSKLKSLQTLKMDGIGSLTFGKGFGRLEKFQKLDVSGKTGNCSFERISKDMFLYTPRLVYLDVSACNILEIEEGPFGNLKYLEHLDVSFNQHLGFWSLPNITHDLNKTSIKTFLAKGINCLAGMSGTILKRSLQYLQNTKISEINFEKNKLEHFELGLLRVLPDTLRTISMGEMELAQGMFVTDYFLFQNRQFYNISLQMRSIPYQTFDSHCKHDRYRPRMSIEYFNWLEYDNEQREASSSTFISRKKWNDQFLVTFEFPKTLNVFHGNMSRLYGDIPEFKINAPGLREIYMQDNLLYSWDGPVHGIENIEIANLSNNFCSHISKSFLEHARGLRILLMSKNNLGRSLLNDVGGEIFRNTVSLEFLDLSDNNITVLSAHMFNNMNQLRALNLRKNQLLTVNVKMKHMRNINYINLEQNRLATIESESRTLFKRLFQTSKLVIYFSENPILCSCDNIDFLEWITINRLHFQDFFHYNCSFSSSHEFNFMSVMSAKASVTSMKETCKSSIGIYMYIAIATGVLFLLSIVVGIVLVKKIKCNNRNAETSV